jgi:hypothetical protein
MISEIVCSFMQRCYCETESKREVVNIIKKSDSFKTGYGGLKR